MTEENETKIPRHPIKIVAQRAGLSLDVLRAWEKRYGVVIPQRSETNRRLYSDGDVERLVLLRKATFGGRSISRVAQLSTEELAALVAEDEAALAQAPRPLTSTGEELPARFQLEACIGAVERMDDKSLESMLSQAAIELGRPVLIEQLLIPLIQKIGDLWEDGSLRVGHEHLFSSVVRTFLGNIKRVFDTPDSAPQLIITTPAGQKHELGAMIAVATAAFQGWRETYLGPDLPAEDIAVAVQQTKAKAIALSVVYPLDDPMLATELRRLRQLIPEEVPIIVGGRATGAYREVLNQIGAVVVHDMAEFRGKLDELRGSK